jgi:hypothetical protein
MVKITAFVILIFFLYCSLAYSLQLGGVDVEIHIIDVHELLSGRIPFGLNQIKQALLENPFAEVYNLYIDEDLSTLEAVLKTVPTFVVSSFQFMEYVVKGFHNILIRPWFEFKTVNVDRSPYI